MANILAQKQLRSIILTVSIYFSMLLFTAREKSRLDFWCVEVLSSYIVIALLYLTRYILKPVIHKLKIWLLGGFKTDDQNGYLSSPINCGFFVQMQY